MSEQEFPPDEFYQLVGRCIKEWAKIEAQLYEICALILKANRTHVAIIYYRTPTLSARLALTDDLVRTVLPRGNSARRRLPAAIEWERFCREIRPLLKSRNLLAHAPVGSASETEWIDEDGQEMPVHTRWLFVGTGWPERLTGKGAEEIGHPELPTHLKDVIFLEGRLQKFTGWLMARGRRVRRAKLLRRKARQRLARSRRKRRAQRRPPPRSSRA
jgi:hypothetical protein